MMGPPRPYFSGDDQVRLGLAFADGTRLTNLAPVIVAGSDDPPQPPLLAQLWAGGFGGRWDQRYWVWGLPPAGPLVVVVESPSRQIPETRVEMPSAEILTAAGRAEVLWEEEGDTYGGIGHPFGPATIFAPEPEPTGTRPADEAAAEHEIEVALPGPRRFKTANSSTSKAANISRQRFVSCTSVFPGPRRPLYITSRA